MSLETKIKPMLNSWRKKAHFLLLLVIFRNMQMCEVEGRDLNTALNDKKTLGVSVSCSKLRSGPCSLFTCWFMLLNFFLPKLLICFLMKMICMNKHCERSTDAVCDRITWKNNDERHPALMRHLELQIKRQPGLFLRSVGNCCLSSAPFASLRLRTPIWLPNGEIFFLHFWLR